MASQRAPFRSISTRKNNTRTQRAIRPADAGSTAAQPRRNAAQAMRPGIGSGLAALAIFACTFGPIPDASTTIDATNGNQEVETSRKVIDTFLADSRRYLGL